MTKHRLAMFYKGDINNQWLTKGCFMFYKGDINNDWPKVALCFVNEI